MTPTISPEVPRLVHFYNVVGPVPRLIGTARLTDHGALVTTGAADSIGGTPRSRSLGPEGFMRWYGAGWSNGYCASRAEDD